MSPSKPSADDTRAWSNICSVERLPVDRGVSALAFGQQIAIFRLSTGELYALSNFDPFSSAFVMSRGLVGDRAECPKVASPVYKNTFDLRTGVCFEDPSVRLTIYPVRVRDGIVQVAAVAASAQQKENAA